jgi:1-acyl-sn-glycerol-3-phosphate acyltransferase
MSGVQVAFLAVTTVLAACALCIWRALKCEAGWRPWVCYQVARFQAALFARLKATIPETGPAIIVANHTSPVDPPLLWIRHFAAFSRPHLRVIGYLMAREYYKKGIVGWVCHAMESIPVERAGRDMAPLREALRRLEAGKLLGLFPEGRLNQTSPDTRLLPGGTGVAWLALKSGAPVIPVFIRHSPRSQSMLRAFFTFSRTTLTYGPPVDLSPWVGKKPDSNTLAEATDRIMKSIADLGGVAFSPVTESPKSEQGLAAATAASTV